MPGGAKLLALDLDKDNTGPLYRQLYDLLRLMILDGRLPSGSRLPANRVLAQDLSLSRNTVATALQQLLAEGYVETRRGDGTYVASELPDDVLGGPSKRMMLPAAMVFPDAAKPWRRSAGPRWAVPRPLPPDRI